MRVWVEADSRLLHEPAADIPLPPDPGPLEDEGEGEEGSGEDKDEEDGGGEEGGEGDSGCSEGKSRRSPVVSPKKKKEARILLSSSAR